MGCKLPATTRRPATLWVEARRFRLEALNPKAYLISMSALSQLPCPSFWDLFAFKFFTFASSLDSHVHPFGISLLSILYICLPAWVVMSALLGSLCFQILYMCFQLGYSCPSFWDLFAFNSLHLSPSLGSDVRLFGIALLSNSLHLLPAWVVMSILLGSLCFQFFTLVSQLG